MSSSKTPPALDEYQVGWICALPIEAAAAQEMLDEEFGVVEVQDNADPNVYTLGRIGKHYVVIACLAGKYGATSAMMVASNMMRTFSKSLHVGLMVGIGGAIPSAINDIRLGDIVVSYPVGKCGGVLQYDLGQFSVDGEPKFNMSFNSPPRLFLAAVDQMRSTVLREDPIYPSYIQQAVRRNKQTRRSFGCPDLQYDRLFQIHYEHVSAMANCEGCLVEWEVERSIREDSEPQVHYGIIASANTVIKHGETREKIRIATNALCFEMEAAGLMQDFPCIVIRGICDYSDSHKNKQWQGYAALAAAAYAKEMLGHVPQMQSEEHWSYAIQLGTIVEEVKDLIQESATIKQKLDIRLHTAGGAAFDSFENQHINCLPGTRTDILRALGDWAESSDGKCIFWLKGKAGTGKSAISRAAAISFSSKDLLGGSFFFKRGDQDRGTARLMFPTLAQQLVNRIPRLGPAIQAAIESDPHISEKSLGTQFNRLFLRPLSNVAFNEPTNVLVVIDALDECGPEGINNDMRTILCLLPLVQVLKTVRLRFLLVSRPELTIRQCFDDIASHCQTLDLCDIPESDISHDIELFVENRLSRTRKANKLAPDWPGKGDLQALVSKAVPLFISAANICRYIEDVNWDPQSRLELILTDQSAYVSKMEGTYMPVLRQLIQGQNRRETDQLIEEFKTIVGSIILLATPLSINALSELLELSSSKIRRSLARLHSVMQIPDSLDEEVELLHSSFRDYLLDTEPRETKEGEQLWIDEKSGHHFLTNQCIRLMRDKLKGSFRNFLKDDTERNEIDCQSVDCSIPSELQYACRYWTHHFTRAQDSDVLVKGALSFLKTHFLYWVKMMSLLGLLPELLGGFTDLEAFIHEPGLWVSLGDARRLILKNRQMFDTAPRRVFVSAIIFAPGNSRIGTRLF
ncbi:hypothetical protein BDV25DRAFT_138297 [Aspergillus avenaceus]|uniref:Nephrocystin 3-like N-terminal domain-containing protein n=1 Tax=Aspergillus avenaceus TaxID=36643 RepID=A0A5N6U096_ASPAV|nr:hypothetical protein BDV25DRAFT_138297 [Aspergillus avenaceus]